MEGSGTVEDDEKTRITEAQNDESNQLEQDPIEFNAEKRKRLGAAIQESFLHPKLIKTDKIMLTKPEKASCVCYMYI